MKNRLLIVSMLMIILIFVCINVYAGCGAGNGTLFTYSGSWVPFDNDHAQANDGCYWHSKPGNQYYVDNYAYVSVTIEWVQNGQTKTRTSSNWGNDICGLIWTDTVWADNDNASARSFHQINCYYCGDNYYNTYYDPDV